MSRPDRLVNLIGYNAVPGDDINVIPSAAPSPELGKGSVELGFPPITREPIVSGGEPALMQDMNGFLNLLSGFSFFYQSGGKFIWTADEPEYLVGNEILGSNKLTYTAVQINGFNTVVQDPVLDLTQTYWEPSGGKIVLSKFLISGTWVKPLRLLGIEVECQAPGGGSGGSSATIAGETAVAAGSSGGAYVKIYISANDLGSTEDYLIGAPGVAGAIDGDGGDAGNVSFGLFIEAGGGKGSPKGDNESTLNGVSGILGGVVITPGDININGGPSGSATSESNNRNSISKGGDSKMGWGGNPVFSSSEPGTDYGSGCSGQNSGQSVAAKAGVEGQPGIIIIKEIYGV